MSPEDCRGPFFGCVTIVGMCILMVLGILFILERVLAWQGFL